MRDTREESHAGSRGGHLEGHGLHRGATGLHRGTRIGLLLGNFSPLKTDRNNFRLDHLPADHPDVVVMGRAALGVLDPGRRTSGQQLRLLNGDTQGNRERLDRDLVHLI